MQTEFNQSKYARYCLLAYAAIQFIIHWWAMVAVMMFTLVFALEAILLQHIQAAGAEHDRSAGHYLQLQRALCRSHSSDTF